MSEASRNILLSSQDPLFIKGIYGHIRDAGYEVDTIEHPADAVKSVMKTSYSYVILDSRDIGLNASEAAAIIKTVSPDTSVIVIGQYPADTDLYALQQPDDIDLLKNLINKLTMLKLKAHA